MDNANIHMFRGLEDAMHQCGTRLTCLPPYSLELDPIEVCFGQLKRWIQKIQTLCFHCIQKSCRRWQCQHARNTCVLAH